MRYFAMASLQCSLSARILGLAEAQFNLALCYQEGFGVAQDLEQAAAWYSKAAGQGMGEARQALERLLAMK